MDPSLRNVALKLNSVSWHSVIIHKSPNTGVQTLRLLSIIWWLSSWLRIYLSKYYSIVLYSTSTLCWNSSRHLEEFGSLCHIPFPHWLTGCPCTNDFLLMGLSFFVAWARSDDPNVFQWFYDAVKSSLQISNRTLSLVG